jgi:uncharacterized protein
MITAVYILVMLAAVYVLAMVVIYFAQPFILYFSDKKVLSTPDDYGIKFENVTVVTADNVRINAWYVPADKSEFTVIYCHGNGGNLMYYLKVVSFLNGLNLSCLLFDYRGYGSSEGKPTEEGTYLDAEAACKWLVSEKKISPDKIIIFGWSLGASVASHLATKIDCASLVLDGAFTAYADITRKHFPFMPASLFAKYNYRTIDYLKNVRRPVMITHSRNDEVAPFRFGQKLFCAANEPKKFVETAGRHNNAFTDSAEIYKKAWLDWIKFLRAKDDQINN